jgi:hypothetical protein
MNRDHTILLTCLAMIAIALACEPDPALCAGSWCPPTPCYGGDCAECLCIRDSYPDPGYCASID